MINNRFPNVGLLIFLLVIVVSCNLQSPKKEIDKRLTMNSEPNKNDEYLDSLVIQKLILVESNDVNTRYEGIEGLGEIFIKKVDERKRGEISEDSEKISAQLNKKLIEELVQFSSSENIVEGSEPATLHKKSQKNAILILRTLLKDDPELKDSKNSSDKEFYELTVKRFKQQ